MMDEKTLRAALEKDADLHALVKVLYKATLIDGLRSIEHLGEPKETPGIIPSPASQPYKIKGFFQPALSKRTGDVIRCQRCGQSFFDPDRKPAISHDCFGLDY